MKPLPRRTRRNELTIQVRSILSDGMDHMGDLDHMTPVPRNRYGQSEPNLWSYIKGMYPPCPSDVLPGPDARLDFLREQWSLHKDEVTAWHLAKRRDGSRPWAF